MVLFRIILIVVMLVVLVDVVPGQGNMSPPTVTLVRNFSSFWGRIVETKLPYVTVLPDGNLDSAMNKMVLVPSICVPTPCARRPRSLESL